LITQPRKITATNTDTTIAPTALLVTPEVSSLDDDEDARALAVVVVVDEVESEEFGWECTRETSAKRRRWRTRASRIVTIRGVYYEQEVFTKQQERLLQTNDKHQSWPGPKVQNGLFFDVRCCLLLVIYWLMYVSTCITKHHTSSLSPPK